MTHIWKCDRVYRRYVGRTDLFQLLLHFDALRVWGATIDLCLLV